MHPDCPLTTAANEDGATLNYDQRGGPFNLDTPLQQPPGLRAWAEGDPAEHHQLDVHARLLPKAWTPKILLTFSAAVGKSGRVHVKGGTDPLSPEVGGAACQ